MAALSLFLLAPCDNGGGKSNDLAMAESLASTGRLANEERVTTEAATLELPKDKLCSALKPGAVLGISDHVASTGTDVTETAQALHHFDPERIKADLADSCIGVK